MSGSNKQMQVGGFIADFVKGNKSTMYPSKIWEGVVLHRRIDEFTDNHKAVKEAVKLLKPSFGRYSAIIVDMYFDYFLARNFSKHTNSKNLWLFTNSFSINAIVHYRHLPEKVKNFIFHFAFTNRLYKYRSISGLYESLQIMSNYKIKSLRPEECIHFLIENENALYPLFNILFDDLKAFSTNEINKLH